MINLFDEHHLEFIEILNKHGVEYLLIGGIAVNIYGYNRGTGDLDIWINPSEANKYKLIVAIEEFGYDADAYKKMSPDEITMFSLGSRNNPGHIEITNRIAGISFQDAWKNFQVFNFDGLAIKFIGLDDLIKNKLASARNRDLDDVENLKLINSRKDPE